MKKLNLKALGLGAREILNREQLRNVLGGDGSGSGGSTCKNQARCCYTFNGVDQGCTGWSDCTGNDCTGYSCSNSTLRTRCV